MFQVRLTGNLKSQAHNLLVIQGCRPDGVDPGLGGHADIRVFTAYENQAHDHENRYNPFAHGISSDTKIFRNPRHAVSGVSKANVDIESDSGIEDAMGMAA
ncbi:hypothetical protein DSCA_18910 [Desulfosarcina alkanivorans]|uniref:Uncharacterized protein n=1 Tax=Desulfosarcina alkanivorans TaxID=571177 RepID=A0A5K7YM80_9BACT|nr:hypothetical protein DSCA_18910 [Desulfosarcina alkanivorans]